MAKPLDRKTLKSLAPTADAALNKSTLKSLGIGGLAAAGVLGAYDWLTPQESYEPLTAGLAAGGITGLGLASKPAQALVSRLTGKVDKEAADAVYKELKAANVKGKTQDDIADVLKKATDQNKKLQKTAKNIDIANKVGLGTTLGAGAIGAAYMDPFGITTNRG